MSYRNDLDALEARHDALDAEVARQTAERDRTRSLLEDAKKRASLPILDNIRVAAPCNASWDAMSGDDRVRHCGDCKKNVYNLSEMTREEAEALLAAREGSLCVRYYKRSDGTIITQDCSVGLRKRRRRRLIVAAGATIVAAGAATAAFFVTRAHHDDYTVMMGGPMSVHQDVLPVDVKTPPHEVFMGGSGAPVPEPAAPPSPPVPAPPA
jgi:hypothetical protein